MGIIGWLKGLFGPREPHGEFDPEAFVFVVIRASVGPMERGDKYEDELDDVLQQRGLGAVTGGGSQLGDPREDGTPTIAWCGIDVDLTGADSRDAALEVLRAQLVKLGAPVGSELHYTADGSILLDRFDTNGWVLRQPREDVHPGFGC